MTGERSPKQLKSRKPAVEPANPTVEPAAPESTDWQQIVQLQRVVGNQGVQRLLAQRKLGRRQELFADGSHNEYGPETDNTGEIIRRVDDPQAATPAPAQPSQAQPSGVTPVVWGYNTAVPHNQRIYASVLSPGHSLTAIMNYIYESPAEMIDQVRSANTGLPEDPEAIIPAGRNLVIPNGRPTSRAHQDIDQALRSGAIVRTEGMNADDNPDVLYVFSANNQQYQLTAGQMRGMLNGLRAKLQRKAGDLGDMAQWGLDTQIDHRENTNSAIRWISDKRGGVEMPADSRWHTPRDRGWQIRDRLRDADLSDPIQGARIIQAAAQDMETVAQQLAEVKRDWHIYIEGTIAGAGAMVSTLEFVRDTSFTIAISIGAVYAAPVVAAQLGTGALATGAIVTTGGAGTGAILQGGSNLAGQALTGENIDWGEVRSQSYEGAVHGGVAAASSLVAPGVTNAVSKGIFGAEASALTSFGSRAVAKSLAGMVVGAPSGMVDAALVALPDLVQGRISTDDYLSRIGWAGFIGGTVGGAFGVVDAALTRPAPQSTALAQAGPDTMAAPEVKSPSAAPEAGPSVWEPAPPQVDPATGRVTQYVQHKPTGEVFQLQMDPATGNGSLTRMATGEVVQIAGGNPQKAPAGLLGAGEPAAPVGGSPVSAAAPEGLPAVVEVSPKQTQAPQVRESQGAKMPARHQHTDPFSGETHDVSATAKTPRSMNTAIWADKGESLAYNQALSSGEIGLQRPAGANVPGVDFITAARDAQGKMQIWATDVKTSVKGKFPADQNKLPAAWLDEVQKALDRLNLGDPALEAEIRQALQQGRVRPRQVNVDFSPDGQGSISGL